MQFEGEELGALNFSNFGSLKSTEIQRGASEAGERRDFSNFGSLKSTEIPAPVAVRGSAGYFSNFGSLKSTEMAGGRRATGG